MLKRAQSGNVVILGSDRNWFLGGERQTLPRLSVVFLILLLMVLRSPYAPVSSQENATIDISITRPDIVVKAGENCSTYVRVTIRGANDTVVLSHSGEPPGVGISLTPNSRALESGGSFDSVLEVSSSNYAQEGNYSIVISAFGLQSSVSNFTILNVTITTSIDLAATSLVVAPPSPKENGEAEFYASVMNRGYGDVSSIQTRFILDTQILENRTIDLLPSGQSASVVVEWSPVTKGYHNLTFVVDPDNLIKETTRENNVKMLVFEAQAQTFSVTVQIEGLEQGKASLYVNDAWRFTGSGVWSDTFEVGTTVTIRLDEDVTVAEDTLYHTDEDYWPGISGTTAFSVHYYPKFHLTIDSYPQGAVRIPGSGWYSKGTCVLLSAPQKSNVDSNVQLRFDYWSLGSTQIVAETLTYTVEGAAHLTAFYAYFYKVSLGSEYGEFRVLVRQGVCQEFWCSNGAILQWEISDKDVAAPGVQGVLGFRLRPNATSGSFTVATPVTIFLEWKTDWVTSTVGFLLRIGIIGILVAICNWVYGRGRLRPSRGAVEASLASSEHTQSRIERAAGAGERETKKT